MQKILAMFVIGLLGGSGVLLNHWESDYGREPVDKDPDG
jgi:hypothetical protein